MSGTLADRVLTGEILDRLAPDDPRARASRRDLARINAIMFQPGIMASLLRAHVPVPPRRVLEIGGGDGRFMLAVARRLARDWPDVDLTILDLSDLVSQPTRAGFAKLGWTVRVVTQDVFDWAARDGGACDAITANLVLHHFTDDRLRALFTALPRRARVLVAAEPLRSRFALVASHMVRAVGANDVTRHDAPASVRAGFRGRELSALWPHDSVLFEGRRGPFTHAFAARGL